MNKKTIKRSVLYLLLAFAVVFSFGAAGEICGSFFDTTAAAFGSKFPDNKAEDMRAVVGRMGAPQPIRGVSNSSGKPIAVMVVDANPRALVAFDLSSGSKLWQITPPVRSGLTIEGDLLIFQSGYKVAGHSLLTGQVLWEIEIEEGWEYHGADVFGDLAVVSIGVGGEEAGSYANGRIIAVNAKTGAKKWDNYSGGGLLGAPSIHGKHVFVPWDRQKLAVIDAAEGNEICRLRADDYTINYVDAGPAGVYYGSLPTSTSLSSIFRFDEKAASGTRAGSTSFTPALEPVPGDPAFLDDAFARPIAGRSAAEKIRFHWLPAVDPAAPIAMTDGAYYLHYWRYVIAFDAATNHVRWTYSSERDIESMRPVPGGVVAVDSDGKLFFIDVVSGASIWQLETGNKVLTAAFDAAGFSPPGGGQAAADPLIKLKELIWDKDNRMLPIRSYAAFLIADIPKPEVTKDLLDIYSDPGIPKGLRDAVVKALAKRTTGAEYLVKALAMRYDFLEQTQAPPMQVVAPALINMNERSAVPGLLTHLMNHETSVEALREVARAIDALGDPSVVGTLTQFLTLYHADSSFLGYEDALTAAAKGILTHGGPQGEKFVAGIRDDSQTLPELKSKLLEVLDPEAAAKAAAEAAAAEQAAMAAQQAQEAEALAAQAANEEANRPRSITNDQVSATIVENQQMLKPCIQAALGLNPNLRSVRMKFSITGDTGKASGLQILPSDVPGLLECLSSGLDAIQFPKFKNLRQTATYTIAIAGAAPAPGYNYPVQPAPGQPQPGKPYDPDSFGQGGFVPPPTPAPQPQPGQPQPQPQPGQPYDPDAF